MKECCVCHNRPVMYRLGRTELCVSCFDHPKYDDKGETKDRMIKAAFAWKEQK